MPNHRKPKPAPAPKRRESSETTRRVPVEEVLRIARESAAPRPIEPAAPGPPSDPPSERR